MTANTPMTRRLFIGTAASAASLLCATGLAGCNGSSSDGASSNTEAPAWTSTQDDTLDVLCMQVSGGAVVAMPGDGWAPRDGFVQLQLSGGSIPGQEIESVTCDGKKLTVKLKAGDGASTLDLMLTEYRLEGGDAASIEGVTVDYGNGEKSELDRAYE